MSSPIFVALQADTGKWFTRCRGCQQTVGDNPDTVTVHVDKPTADQPYARFEVVNVGGGKITQSTGSLYSVEYNLPFLS